jgi:glycerol-3-phosphate acyltransferase PlsX
MRIAVDAMGGDRAPHDIVSGALDAARIAKNRYEVVLVGDEASVRAEIEKHRFIKDLPVSVVHASQRVEMDEPPAQALKQKPDSSIAVAMRLHKEGKVDAVISAGNTGAVLAASLFLLRPIEGVMRPAVGAFIPCGHGNVSLLIDGGTNVDCKPIHLVQFGLMGSILMNHLFGIESPRVGLLNIGEEPGKGNETVIEAHTLLARSPVRFIGNIEGRDVMRSKADVIVCDGFTGNVLIKFMGSLSKVISSTLKRKIGGNIAGSVGAFLMAHKLQKLVKVFDYREYGGAPLLGVKGTVIIAHGSSSAYAMMKAIEEGHKLALKGLPGHIEQQIRGLKEAHA